MIKLTLNPESLPLEHTFHQKTIVIGCEESLEADLRLPEKDIKASHIKIVAEDNHFLVINLANDPFVTLNGLPFGKKLLQNKDILQVGHTLIRFENDSPMHCSPVEKIVSINEAPLVETILNNYRLPEDFDRILEENVLEESLVKEGIDLDSFLKGMGKVDYIPEPPPLESMDSREDLENPANPVIESPPAKKTLEDYYSVEFDDESENFKTEDQKSEPQEGVSFSTWKFIFALLFAVISLFSIALGILYVNISDKIAVEEINAARGVSDVAMALTYAQINHIKPQKQNWSDPEFLRNNLATVLTSDFLYLSNLETHGSFSNCPYILRIYPSNDFSQFLVIALPAPSFLQWLFPKNAIIVDSRAMEIRKIQDLRALNRLLVSQNTYDGTNAEEISNLVKHGTLIHLAHIANKTNDYGFMPPKELPEHYPDAENLIYNAPRYYNFGESFMQKSIALSNTASPGSFEASRHQQTIIAMSHLPNLILYSSEGESLATEAQKAIESFVPQKKFLTAVLEFDEQGDFRESHLIADNNSNVHEEEIAILDETEPLASEKIEEHFLVLQLKSLSSSREQMLKSISSQIISLLNQHTHEYQEEFAEQFPQLIEQYQKVDSEQLDIIMKELASLYKVYYNESLDQLLDYVKTAGAEDIVTLALKKHAEKIGVQQISNDKIEEFLKNIREAKTFSQLDDRITEAVKKLSLKYIPNLETVVTSQSAMRSLVHQKLSEFMLSPETHLPIKDFDGANRTLLEHILQAGWITEQVEYDFYMNEFDRIHTEATAEATETTTDRPMELIEHGGTEKKELGVEDEAK